MISSERKVPRWVSRPVSVSQETLSVAIVCVYEVWIVLHETPTLFLHSAVVGA